MRRLALFVLLFPLLFVGCGGGGDAADEFVGTWATRDLVRASTGDMPCPVPLNISGNRATLGGAATCTRADGSTISISAWTLNVDGNAGSETGAGTIAKAGAGSCTFTATSTLTR